MIKARDVEKTLKMAGIEKGSMVLFQGIIEQQHAVHEAVAQLAEMIDKMSDILMQQVQVSTHQASTTDQIQKTLGLDDGHDDGVQSEDG